MDATTWQRLQREALPLLGHQDTYERLQAAGFEPDQLRWVLPHGMLDDEECTIFGAGIVHADVRGPMLAVALLVVTEGGEQLKA